jgi:Fe-S cluster biogenesis protein NfuA
MRPYLDSHGGDVQLVGIEDGVVRLQLQGSCSGCPSSAITLRHGIEEAIHRAAPDVAAIEAEDAPAPAGGLLQIELGDALRCPLPGVGAT